MNNKLAAAIFIIISLALAVLGTILIPGEKGFYIGIGLIALTISCSLFPKKKV